MVWGVTKDVLSENMFYFVRMVVSLVLCVGGISILAAAWFASYQVAVAFPTKSISELPIDQLVYNAVLPGGIGIALFLFGLVSRYATKGAIPWFVIALLIWTFGGYNLYNIGMYNPRAPFSDYLNQTVVFFLLGLVIMCVGVIFSWHGEVKGLVSKYASKAVKTSEARKDETRKSDEARRIEEAKRGEGERVRRELSKAEEEEEKAKESPHHTPSFEKRHLK